MPELRQPSFLLGIQVSGILKLALGFRKLPQEGFALGFYLDARLFFIPEDSAITLQPNLPAYSFGGPNLD